MQMGEEGRYAGKHLQELEIIELVAFMSEEDSVFYIYGKSGNISKKAEAPM